MQTLFIKCRSKNQQRTILNNNVGLFLLRSKSIHILVYFEEHWASEAYHRYIRMIQRTVGMRHDANTPLIAVEQIVICFKSFMCNFGIMEGLTQFFKSVRDRFDVI